MVRTLEQDVTSGLSATDLERVRDSLADGRKPKVVFTEAAGQVAGQVGQIVALTDPEVSPDWLVVRFGRDELSFSPADLSLAVRGATRRRPEPAEPVAATPALPPGPPLLPPQRIVDNPVVATARTARSSATSEPANPEPARPTTVSPEGPGVAAAEPTSAGAAGAASAGRTARKAAKPKAPASLTVTLTYAEGEWTVSAVQGSRTVARPAAIRPAEALKMVSLLEVPALQEAVTEIVSTARAEAQAQAEQLRSQLAEIEARLSELETD